MVSIRRYRFSMYMRFQVGLMINWLMQAWAGISAMKRMVLPRSCGCSIFARSAALGGTGRRSMIGVATSAGQIAQADILLNGRLDVGVGRGHAWLNDPANVDLFENVERYDQLIVTGPIQVRSTCAHHMMPIYGEAYVGVLPSPEGKIIGLSKYDRIVEYFSARLQIQEELVGQIGNYIMDMTKPRGLAIRISAVHMCKTHRGVRASAKSRMVNSAYFGELSRNQSLKSEFMHECLALEQHD